MTLTVSVIYKLLLSGVDTEHSVYVPGQVSCKQVMETLRAKVRDR